MRPACVKRESKSEEMFFVPMFSRAHANRSELNSHAGSEQRPASTARGECAILDLRWRCDNCDKYTETTHSPLVKLAAAVRFFLRRMLPRMSPERKPAMKAAGERGELPGRNAEIAAEVIAGYKIHPVAAMFPLLEGADYEALKANIRANGQMHPVMVEGDGRMLDGRNRARICVELGFELKVEQYKDALDPVEYIVAANLHRRHLNDDQRVQIATRIHGWRIQQQNAEKKTAGKSADGKAGGRGRKNLTLNSASGLSEPKTRARDARTTAGQIAAAAKTTRYKAEKALAVNKHSLELEAEVIQGNISLAEAHKEVAPAGHSLSAAAPSVQHASRNASRRKPALPREGTRKRAQWEQTAKRRMINGLAMIHGSCRGLAELNIDLIAPVLVGEEKPWIKIAKETSQILRRFARKLAAAALAGGRRI